jgi:hypothetical protein
MRRSILIHRYGGAAEGRPPLAGNLGDAIQTLALEDALARAGRRAVDTVDRDVPRPELMTDVLLFDRELDAPVSPDACLVLANGYLGGPWHGSPGWTPAPGRRTLFAGVHVHDVATAARVLAAAVPDVPIGARDPHTRYNLVSAGADPGLVEVVGCASLCVAHDAGPRAGVIAVDLAPRSDLGPEPLASWSHQIPLGLDWAEQVALATCALGEYSRAEAVLTTRLHAFLPALAMGTPASIHRRAQADFPGRIGSLLEFLGLPEGRVVDPSDLAIADALANARERYILFLKMILELTGAA